MGKYALLFAGCVNEKWAFDRYANDLGFMFNILTNKYKYDQDNITILYSGGKEIIYSEGALVLNISTSQASIDNLEDIIEYYIQNLTEDDELLVMFSNHGDQAGKCLPKMATINLWGDDVVSQDHLCIKFMQINAKKVLLFGQCFGGDFLSTKIPNSIMISANFRDMPSYCNITKDYDEFFYHFISYFNGSYPNGSPLFSSNSKLTIADAFNYAKKNDRYKKPEPQSDGTIRFQVPQITSSGLDPETFVL